MWPLHFDEFFDKCCAISCVKSEILSGSAIHDHQLTKESVWNGLQRKEVVAVVSSMAIRTLIYRLHVQAENAGLEKFAKVRN